MSNLKTLLEVSIERSEKNRANKDSRLVEKITHSTTAQKNLT